MGMKLIARHLASEFRQRTAGKAVHATRDLLFAFHDLLKAVGCQRGPARSAALAELRDLQSRKIVLLETHRGDPDAILRVRFPLDRAGELFQILGEPSPHDARLKLQNLFLEAADETVPTSFANGWRTFCLEMAEAAATGSSLAPFDRSKPDQIHEILGSLPRILAWESESLRRFASTILFGDSKRLESLQPRIESCLSHITGVASSTLADFGILPNERGFLLHGPVTLEFPDGSLPLGLLRQPLRLSATDVRRATILPNTRRCLTVENASMLYELAKLQSQTLLVSSGSEGGFANSAVIEFLRTLPPQIELWHFGDSDPKGFEILRDLRERSGRCLRSLHMVFRPAPDPAPALTTNDRKTIDRLLAGTDLEAAENCTLRAMLDAGQKGCFEQESLGIPHPTWPFF